jgi:hypothetical protein
VGQELGKLFALSLINGSWNVNAPNGNIYLQEVRNPNGVFNNIGSAKTANYHLFDYSSDAAVNLTAGNGVFLTDINIPRPDGNVPVIYPPTLDISAGAGGVTLQGNVTLFPSADGNLNITTTDGGGFIAQPNTPGTIPTLYMSDSAKKQWTSISSFSFSDHAATPSELNNANPVIINISGDMENLDLITSKATQLTVGGDMIDCGFSGENLSANDITSINVAGQIYNQGSFAFVTLPQSIANVPAADLPPNSVNAWYTIFALLMNPNTIGSLTVPANLPATQWASYAAAGAGLFPLPANTLSSNPGFVYNPATGQLGFGGPMGINILTALTEPLTVLRYGSDGFPIVDANGHFETDTLTWVSPSVIETLYAESQNDPSPLNGSLGYRIGGPGEFDINAGSISLGNSYGILSCGVADPQGGFGRYNNLAAETPEGATVNVTVSGDLDMLTSTIAALGGGNVNVTSTGGSMDLGSQALYNSTRQVGFGIFTSGNGDVNVTALGDINIDGSRIATYNGGDIFIESLDGNVDVGSGGDTFNGVGVSYVDPVTGKADFYAEDVYGSGIVANTLVDSDAVPNGATTPGNITVETPRGNITASLGGILQEALNGNLSGGPTINLVAGTPPSGTPGLPGYFAGYTGNIDLGESGVIGGTVNVTANGNIIGLVISRQNSNINAAQNFSGTVLSGGSADVGAGGSVAGTIIGVGGANVSGGSISASVLGQNVSVNGGAAQSTLGSTASTTSTSQSAAQQSNNDAKQQVASNDNTDDLNKKKKPTLQRLKRVTVILPKAS